MSLEQANAVEASSDLATGTPNAESNDLATRFAGILDLDNGPAPEADKPLDGAEQLADQPEEANEDADFEGLDQEDADPWSGYEDYEFEGKTYKIPTELKDGYLRRDDYTRKTMDLGERERQIEARAQELQAQAARTEDEFNAAVVLHQVNNALQQFGDVNWIAEFQRLQNDPLEFQELQTRYMQFQALQNQRQQVAGFLQHKADERSAQAKQETEARLAKTRDFAIKNIKGWTPELDGKITEFAMKDLGFSKDTLLNAYSPEIYKTLHLAYLGKQTLERQRAAKPATPPPQKTTTVSAKANPQIMAAPEEVSMSDYVAMRKAGKI